MCERVWEQDKENYGKRYKSLQEKKRVRKSATQLENLFYVD